ncbi:MAG: type II toxin-antitoxin system HicB family antitoxin [Chloroflexi bacterium]|nr:type II toxin-antitoxin system HicB family antitoxin [Chloroflexota bacterium]
MGYRVVVERSPNNYSAYSPDYPGVGVAGDSEEEVRRLLAEGIEIWEEEERKDAEREASTDARERTAST